MNYRVKVASNFKLDAKRISKKHKAILSDIGKLIIALENNPTMGVSLGQNVYKIRLSISGTNKGKSGGARVITYVLVQQEVVYLAEIYLKNEHDTVDADIVIQRLKDQGLL